MATFTALARTTSYPGPKHQRRQQKNAHARLQEAAVDADGEEDQHLHNAEASAVGGTFPVIQRSGLTNMMTSMITIATASTLRKTASSMFTAIRAPRIDPTTVGMDKSSAPRTSSLPWR